MYDDLMSTPDAKHNQTKIEFVVRSADATYIISSGRTIHRSKQKTRSKSPLKVTDHGDKKILGTNIQKEYLKNSQKLQQNLQKSIEIIRK